MLLNQTKISINYHKICVSFGENELDAEMMTLILRILQNLGTKFKFDIIETGHFAYQKHYQNGISPSDLSKLRNSDASFLISSMHNIENEKLDYIKYVDIALEGIIIITKFLRLDDLSKDFTIIKAGNFLTLSDFDNKTKFIYDITEELYRVVQKYENKILVCGLQDLYNDKIKYLKEKEMLQKIYNFNDFKDNIFLFFDKNLNYFLKILPILYPKLSDIKTNIILNSYNIPIFVSDRIDNKASALSLIISTEELLKFFGYYKESYFLRKITSNQILKNEDDQIKFLQNISSEAKKYTELKDELSQQNISLIRNINIPNYRIYLEKNQNISEELFINLKCNCLVKELVQKIKNKDIVLPSGYILHSIYQNEIELYPNENFWNSYIFDAKIKLTNDLHEKFRTVL